MNAFSRERYWMWLGCLGKETRKNGFTRNQCRSGPGHLTVAVGGQRWCFLAHMIGYAHELMGVILTQPTCNINPHPASNAFFSIWRLLQACSMASPETDQPTNAPLSPHLPFQALDDTELNHFRSGPRMSSCHSQPQVYYGPVSIRTWYFPLSRDDILSSLYLGNYLAGHAKKTLRVPKRAVKPDLYQVFIKLPIELQLVVS